MKKWMYLFLFLPLMWGCSSNDDFSNVTDQEISTMLQEAKKEPIKDVNKLPKWLKDVVLSSHNGHFVEIHAFNYKGTTYLLLSDMADSSLTNGIRFYTTKGEQIIPEGIEGDWENMTGLYMELYHCDKNLTLVYSAMKQ